MGTTILELIHEHTIVIHHLKLNLHRSRQRMQAQVDNHRTERSFTVGEWVWLRLQRYHQHFVERHRSPKLAPRFSGPYSASHRKGGLRAPTPLVITHPSSVSRLSSPPF